MEERKEPERYPYQIVRENIHQSKAHTHKEEITEEFRKIINSYSLENDSNTPDFIMAEYLYDCLIAANILIGSRTVWYNPEGVGSHEVQAINDPFKPFHIEEKPRGYDGE